MLVIILLIIAGPSLKLLNLLKWKDEQDQEHVFRLVDRVCADWKNFGINLGITNSVLEGLNKQYLGECSTCWNEVMDKWLNGVSEEYPVTWEGLYSLLADTKYPTVAKELEEAVNRV